MESSVTDAPDDDCIITDEAGRATAPPLGMMGMVFGVDPLGAGHEFELRARSWVEPRAHAWVRPARAATAARSSAGFGRRAKTRSCRGDEPIALLSYER